MSEPFLRRLTTGSVRRVRGVVSVPANRAVWLQLGKAALATAVAWEVAHRVTDSIYPVFAPLAAMLTVQATVVESLRTGVQRTLGVVCGVLLAFGLASALGLHWWSVGLLVFLGLLLGQSLKLGTQGSTQVAVSALLVLVLTGGSESYAIDRVVDTLIGAAVGGGVALVFVPPLHVRDSGRAIRGLADAIASVVSGIAKSLRGGWPGTSARKWLEQARALDGEVSRARDAVDRGDASIRYNLRSRGNAPVVSLHRDALRRLSHAEIQVLGIARTLADEADAIAKDDNPDPPLPDELRGQLVNVLVGAADALRLAGLSAVDEHDTVGSQQVLRELRAKSAAATADARALVRAARTRELPARQWLVLGSVLTDLRRLISEIGGRDQPLGFTLRSRRRGDARLPRRFARRRPRRSRLGARDDGTDQSG